MSTGAALTLTERRSVKPWATSSPPTHELMLRELESRTAMTELIQQIRRDELPTGHLMATAAAMGKAMLDAERALQTGRLTIVDAPCWEAMGAAYIELSRLRTAMATRVDAPDMQTPEKESSNTSRASRCSPSSSTKAS